MLNPVNGDLAQMIMVCFSYINNVMHRCVPAMYLKFSSESSGQHMIYVKQHSVRERHPEKPSDRTLFMLDVPPYCTEVRLYIFAVSFIVFCKIIIASIYFQDSLKHAWKECGAVRSVFFHSKPTASIPTVDESPFFPTQEVVKVYLIFANSKQICCLFV